MRRAQVARQNASVGPAIPRLAPRIARHDAASHPGRTDEREPPDDPADQEAPSRAVGLCRNALRSPRVGSVTGHAVAISFAHPQTERSVGCERRAGRPRHTHGAARAIRIRGDSWATRSLDRSAGRSPESDRHAPSDAIARSTATGPVGSAICVSLAALAVFWQREHRCLAARIAHGWRCWSARDQQNSDPPTDV